jgi:poly-gamma-glutamate synthesis protein (capsule biosynthesis protein)
MGSDGGVRQLAIMMVGDLILDEPDPASYFELARATLRRGDIGIGHIEVPHSEATDNAATAVAATPSDPGALAVLPDAGLHVVTLAGNHVFDAGAPGVLDTIRHASAAGLLTAGAGRNIGDAREPAIIERAGIRVAILSYNCVGPRESYATSRKAGCAYVRVLTHYELDHSSPGGPPRVYTFVEPDDLATLQDDIGKARDRADVVIIGFHKGIVHTPAVLAMYERPLTHAAVDFGADVVLSHHAHILRGVEVYRGRPIFHGLGNFVTVTHALSVSCNDSAERAAWARRRVELYGFAPDPDMPSYPFHPESRNTAIATVYVGSSGVTGAGLIPCWINDAAQPTPVRRTGRGADVIEYIKKINAAADLSTELMWLNDEEVSMPGIDCSVPLG